MSERLYLYLPMEIRTPDDRWEDVIYVVEPRDIDTHRTIKHEFHSRSSWVSLWGPPEHCRRIWYADDYIRNKQRIWVCAECIGEREVEIYTIPRLLPGGCELCRKQTTSRGFSYVNYRHFIQSDAEEDENGSHSNH